MVALAGLSGARWICNFLSCALCNSSSLMATSHTRMGAIREGDCVFSCAPWPTQHRARAWCRVGNESRGWRTMALVQGSGLPTRRQVEPENASFSLSLCPQVWRRRCGKPNPEASGAEGVISMVKHPCLCLEGWLGFPGTVIYPLLAVCPGPEFSLGGSRVVTTFVHMTHEPLPLCPLTCSPRCSVLRDELGGLLKRPLHGGQWWLGAPGNQDPLYLLHLIEILYEISCF